MVKLKIIPQIGRVEPKEKIVLSFYEKKKKISTWHSISMKSGSYSQINQSKTIGKKGTQDNKQNVM